MATSKKNDPADKINRLLDVIEKHMNEKDCQHTFVEVFKEYLPSKNKKNNNKSI